MPPLQPTESIQSPENHQVIECETVSTSSLFEWPFVVSGLNAAGVLRFDVFDALALLPVVH